MNRLSIGSSTFGSFKRQETFEKIKPTWYSFDSLLDNAYTFELFLTFLASESNQQNMDFVREVDDYNSLRSHPYRMKKAKHIIDTYVKDGSQKEINISSDQKKAILTNYDICCQSVFEKGLFLDAYKSIWLDFNYDSFPRFLQSGAFLKYMKSEWERLGMMDFYTQYLQNDFTLVKQEMQQKGYKDPEENINQELESLEKSHEATFNLDMTTLEITDLKSFGISQERLIQIAKAMMKPLTGIPIVIPKTGFLIQRDAKPTKREFKGIPLMQWLGNELKTSNDTIILKVIQLYMKRKLIEHVNPKLRDFDEKSTYKFGVKKRVVVIGTGFSGMVVARALKADFEVICIDSKPSLYYKYSFHKLFVDPNRIKDLEFPLTKIVDGCTFVNDEVVDISSNLVYLAGGKNISFDYLVIATGSKYHVPFPVERSEKILGAPPAHIVNMYNPKDIIGAFGSIYYGKKVAIIGAGPSAIEVAAEIASGYPKTQVVMIAQYLTLLERKSKDIQREVYKLIQKIPNLTIVFNRKVVKIVDREIFYKLNILDGNKVEEESIEADCVVICAGFRPNTTPLRKYMSDSINKNGYVKVNRANQVLYSGVKKDLDVLMNEMEEVLKNDERELISKYGLKKEGSQTHSPSPSPSPQPGRDRETTEKDVFDMLKNDEIPETVDTDVDSDEMTDNDTPSKDEAYQNIFAIGDCCDSGDEKLAYFAIEHAKKVVRNIRAIEYAVNTFKLTKLKCREGRVVICVGKNGILVQGGKVLKIGVMANNAKEMVEKAFREKIN